MNWTHGVAFLLGFVFFVAVALFKKPKGEVHTRRDFMASSALRARIACEPAATRYEIAQEAVRDADALIKALDEMKGTP